MMVLASEAKELDPSSSLAPPTSTMANVFATGNHAVTSKELDPSTSSLAPPKPLLIFSPTLEGSYPVLMFLHGFYLRNKFYSQLLRLISSHGYIVVAPQLYLYNLPPKGTEEVESAALVANWLPTRLQPALPSGVLASLQSLSLAGHSRGGKCAYALALGHAPTTLPISSLIAIDPVAGVTRTCRTSPEILTYSPRSLHLPFPVTVVGTGLGPEKRNCCMPPCAPVGVNYEEFFSETNPPCYLFVARDCGHMDMLDDELEGVLGVVAECLCKNGSVRGGKGLVRSGVSGIVVAALKGQSGDLDVIVANPEIAPIVLDPVRFVPA